MQSPCGMRPRSGREGGRTRCGPPPRPSRTRSSRTRQIAPSQSSLCPGAAPARPAGRRLRSVARPRTAPRCCWAQRPRTRAGRSAPCAHTHVRPDSRRCTRRIPTARRGSPRRSQRPRPARARPQRCTRAFAATRRILRLPRGPAPPRTPAGSPVAPWGRSGVVPKSPHSSRPPCAAAGSRSRVRRPLGRVFSTSRRKTPQLAPTCAKWRRSMTRPPSPHASTHASSPSRRFTTCCSLCRCRSHCGGMGSTWRGACSAPAACCVPLLIPPPPARLARRQEHGLHAVVAAGPDHQLCDLVSRHRPRHILYGRPSPARATSSRRR